MAKTVISTKRVAISKANAQIVLVVGVASFLSVFCLVASRAVWSQNLYQAKVISQKSKANKQLDANASAFNTLSSVYKDFNNSPTNAIGGQKDGVGDNDGNNTKIILDALPSSYDFPALTSSVEKILTDRGFKIASLTGTDDQVNQQTNLSSPTPQPITIPFSFGVTNTDYTSAEKLVTVLEHSIRPIQIDTLELSGGSTDMTMNIGAHTYYEPGKNLTITKQVVK